MKTILYLLTLISVAVPCLGWNPVTDLRQNVVWKFGEAAQAGEGFDFSAGKWRTSALAELAEYRCLSLSYGATFFSENSPQAMDTVKIGFLSSFFFNWFANKPTPAMAWLNQLNVGPSYAVPVFSGQTGHKGVFLLDANFRFGN